MLTESPTSPVAASQSWSAPEGWPALSLKQIEAMLCAPGQPFEMETVEVEGVPTRCWKNAPPSLAALAQIARSHGDKTFLVYEGERVSYDAWFRATATLAQHLQSAGIGKGDRVALAMRNLPEWPVAFFAIVSIGAIAVPLNAWWTGQELAYGLKDSGAKLLIADAERLDRIAPHLAELDALQAMLISRSQGELGHGAKALEDVIGAPPAYAELAPAELPPVEIAPDDAATIFYTSGTTGNPKGALGSHRNMTTNIMTTAYAGVRSSLRRGEAPPAPEPAVMLTVIPLFHVTACSAGMTGVMFAGSTLVFMHKWDATRALEIIEREKVTATGGVPTIAWQLIEHPERDKYDLSSLKSISYGGAPSAPELVRKIREVFGALPGNGWGMTETMATVTSHTAEDYLNRPDSCGPAVPVSDLKIMDADGQTELPVGQVGELWARGPQIVKGYWNKPEATAATFVDGWVRTGDLARLDEEGFCYIVDRAKDMIIRGGENIYSSEVENVLYDHPAVTDAALIGLPHRTLGEEPAAVVHLAPGAEASEAELQAWVRERLAAFKVPVRIVFCKETLPRNANGKILKKDLAGLFG
ncbi:MULTISPECIES: class I adenylate-forming enzyme family protein [Pseudomonadota]|jgi:acyl-CoA synthetase (AMP-forming)/AMP-acid ligase II|uniref:class I adenylate-forming enzyme family protein n=1 Tax=Pseudomonadota TaxID=1224 RepID=UPI00076A40CD|nr:MULTISPECIES: class I adenylate-forming enzyme family protein [Pseudomonadota]MAF61873.1 fatty acid--CoA ligase [Blastomonas sp.]MBA4780297.1 acyl--CoA ligase [Blastomonas sp.]|tara:strand:+ start:25137 stop:26894 length:1758 start_codon:yes stop_codon:yes gene_type:complete